MFRVIILVCKNLTLRKLVFKNENIINCSLLTAVISIIVMLSTNWEQTSLQIAKPSYVYWMVLGVWGFRRLRDLVGRVINSHQDPQLSNVKQKHTY